MLHLKSLSFHSPPPLLFKNGTNLDPVIILYGDYCCVHFQTSGFSNWEKKSLLQEQFKPLIISTTSAFVLTLFCNHPGFTIRTLGMVTFRIVREEIGEATCLSQSPVSETWAQSRPPTKPDCKGANNTRRPDPGPTSTAPNDLWAQDSLTRASVKH